MASCRIRYTLGEFLPDPPSVGVDLCSDASGFIYSCSMFEWPGHRLVAMWLLLCSRPRVSSLHFFLPHLDVLSWFFLKGEEGTSPSSSFCQQSLPEFASPNPAFILSGSFWPTCCLMGCSRPPTTPIGIPKPCRCYQSITLTRPPSLSSRWALGPQAPVSTPLRSWVPQHQPLALVSSLLRHWAPRPHLTSL